MRLCLQSEFAAVNYCHCAANQVHNGIKDSITMDVFGILTDFIAKPGPCPHPPSQHDNMTLYDGAGPVLAGVARCGLGKINNVSVTAKVLQFTTQMWSCS